MHGVGFEPTQLTLPGLKSGSLDHSDNRAYEHFKAGSAPVLPGGLEPPTSAWPIALISAYKNSALTNWAMGAIPAPGIEPGPQPWKGRILTVRL